MSQGGKLKKAQELAKSIPVVTYNEKEGILRLSGYLPTLKSLAIALSVRPHKVEKVLKKIGIIATYKNGELKIISRPQPQGESF